MLHCDTYSMDKNNTVACHGQVARGYHWRYVDFCALLHALHFHSFTIHKDKSITLLNLSVVKVPHGLSLTLGYWVPWHMYCTKSFKMGPLWVSEAKGIDQDHSC